jgi:protein AbiQ
VILEVDGIKYYAPLTSPKPKHKKMKNGKDFRKIAQGEYGAINFNNMIPVTDNALLLKDIENEPNEQYKRLLQNQYIAIKSDMAAIKKTAENLRKLVLTPDEKLGNYDREIKARCCNLTLLEAVYTQYNQPIK